ncbi:MAG TPA: amidohydrolase family protein [Novosphingobium sp.]|nr:amidohydrolase family protein [Novosphingobium sp.]
MADNARGVFGAQEDDAKTYWLAEGMAPGGFIREVDKVANSRGLDSLFAGIKIVDCDTHFTEPADMWTSRAPQGLKSKMPRVEHVDGVDRWFVGDRDFGYIGGNVIGADHNKLLGRLSWPNFSQINRGAYEVDARLADMDAMGVWAQITFQNNGVTQAGSLVALGDEELAYSIIAIYNDALAERQRASGQRLFGMAHLPYWDKQLLDKEIRRIIDLGLKGIVMPDRPERLSEGFIGRDGRVSAFWENVLQTCNDTGLALNFHLNTAMDPTSVIWDNFGFAQRLPVGAIVTHMGCVATMSNFMASGLLDRFEDLKIGLIESGAGWVPFALEALEHQFDEFGTNRIYELQRRPKEYWAKNFWCSFWFEDFAPKHMIEAIGADRLMFETDYPHPTSLYPGVQDKLVEVLGAHDRAVRKSILQDSASNLYNLGL